MKAKDIQRDWIKNALKEGRSTGKTQAGLAKKLGLDQSQGHRIANGQRLLNFAEVALVENYLGKRAPRSISGDEQPMAFDGGRNFTGQARQFVEVPVFEQRIPPGAPLPPGDLTPVGYLPFDEEALHVLSKDVRKLWTLLISTDASRPFLNPGDHALIDPAQTNPSREGRYIVRVDDELLVKLIAMNPGSRLLTVKSDNPDYPTWNDIAARDLDIAGRVIWIARRLV